MFAAVWWVLIEGQLSYAVYALVAVPAAVALSLVLSPPRPGPWRFGPARAWAAVTLTGWVVYRALLGGADVALRAISRTPGGRTDPQVVTVPLRLTGTAQAFALGVFNLMPGTLVQGTEVQGTEVKRADAGPTTTKGKSAEDSHAVSGASARPVALVHVLSPDFDAPENFAALEDRVAAVVGQKFG